jgi:hypothetical protein
MVQQQRRQQQQHMSSGDAFLSANPQPNALHKLQTKLMYRLQISASVLLVSSHLPAPCWLGQTRVSGRLSCLLPLLYYPKQTCTYTTTADGAKPACTRARVQLHLCSKRRAVLLVICCAPASALLTWSNSRVRKALRCLACCDAVHSRLACTHY